MKKYLSMLLCLSLILFAATASARTFTTLAELQKFIYNHSAASTELNEPVVKLDGTISEITWCGKNNHYNMTLLVDDPNAAVPIGEESPRLTVHFRLHVDPIPFSVGDQISVYGTLNSLYSSYMVPEILAEFINGSDDF